MTQPLTALAHANRVRLHRANVKRRVAALPYRDALRAAAAVVDDVPGDPLLHGMEADALLAAVPSVGRTVAKRLLLAAGARPGVLLGDEPARGLGPRRRALLADELRRVALTHERRHSRAA